MTILQPEEFYKASNLTDNPFRSQPIYGGDPRMGIWVGYDKQRRQMMKFLTRSRADQVGNVNFVMLYGQYGTGKSHALLWAINEILHKRSDEFNSLAYYIPSLKKDKGGLTFAGAYRSDLVNKSSYVNDIWGYRAHLQSTMTRFRDANSDAATLTDEELLKRIYSQVDLYRLANKIHICASPDDLRKLLCPEKMTDYEAMILFTTIVNLVVADVRINDDVRRYKNAVYLMIDEMDDLIRASAKEARDINDILRHMYDLCPNRFGIAIGLSAEIADLTSIFYEYLLDRIQKRIHLDTMGRDDAVEFVQKILDEWRVDPSGETGFFPFEEDAVAAIAGRLNRITPRKIIDVMQQTLEEVRLAGLDPQQRIADETFLEDNEIIEEVLGDFS
ncbi:hypothetical protein [Pseudothauera rhizosphaerae]|uniref:ATP-binding protein n=1 Tax=Pseudothauera rhizosphaerae TaxID=2565932 RepID=A0A4V3WAS0_9RHOO|nr:hypothetical protein [Pseudothauera rhizosphaerae]THF60381.1 hypothetical protein E6O51_14360 [Pseudothauera rhizosphaerae]